MTASDLIHRAMMLERSMNFAREHKANRPYAAHFIENARAHVRALPKKVQPTYTKIVDACEKEIA